MTSSSSGDIGTLLDAATSSIHSYAVYRYAFRSTEKVALQEIGPRFTLKLRSLKKGLPAVTTFADPKKPLEFDNFDEEDAGDEQAASGEMQVDAEADGPEEGQAQEPPQKQGPNTTDEVLWQWKVRVLVCLVLTWHSSEAIV